MTDADHPERAGAVPAGVDPSRPSPARVYSYLLGGDHHFAADRAAAAALTTRAPDLAAAARANRAFHLRAASWIAGQGVSQFIDLGSGLPAAGSTHEAVRRVVPGARVAYIDNDPMVAAYGPELLGADPGAVILQADLRDPDDVLSRPELRRLIDLGRPAGLLATAVLHFVADDSDPAGLIAQYMAALPEGSYLALSHMTADDRPPAAARALAQLSQVAAGGGRLRSRAEVARLFDGLTLVPPGPGAGPEVTWVGHWRSDDPAAAECAGSRWLYGGVARRPARLAAPEY
ncbi:MAG TPA: SAM-dependent methyltransferase [Streptosporangiaceae bacterium]